MQGFCQALLLAFQFCDAHDTFIAVVRQSDMSLIVSEARPMVQVTELTGLEAGELRAKVGSNVMDNTVVSLTGTDIELAPHLRHAGMLPCCHPVHTLLT